MLMSRDRGGQQKAETRQGGTDGWDKTGRDGTGWDKTGRNGTGQTGNMVTKMVTRRPQHHDTPPRSEPAPPYYTICTIYTIILYYYILYLVSEFNKSVSIIGSYILYVSTWKPQTPNTKLLRLQPMKSFLS